MVRHVLSIDQGTSSTRCALFDGTGRMCASAQRPLQCLFPQQGWVELDPEDVYRSVVETIASVMEEAVEVAGIGITNQRETVVVWDRDTGNPLYPAIVWSDTRCEEQVEELKQSVRPAMVKARTGLPVHGYFTALKLMWLHDHVPAVRAAIEARSCMIGTINTWIIWKLTGGTQGGVYKTDVTNAARTLLMDLETLQWDPDMCQACGVPLDLLPTIVSCSNDFGVVEQGPLVGVRIRASIGDQHAALLGQLCFQKGQAKSTVGTGCFVLAHTGPTPVASSALLTTVAYQLGENDEPQYALEGAIGSAGSSVDWMCRTGMLESPKDVDTEAAASSNGVSFVNAFGGLYAPYWRSDARGLVIGLGLDTTKHHIIKALLEGIALQTRDIVKLMESEMQDTVDVVRLDGGMSESNVLAQTVADLVQVSVERPIMLETTALGAAIAAGLHCGYWNSLDDVRDRIHRQHAQFAPTQSKHHVDTLVQQWEGAVERSLGWTEHHSPSLFNLSHAALFAVTGCLVLGIAAVVSARR